MQSIAELKCNKVSKLFILTLFITAKFFTTSVVFAKMYQFSLNLSSLQLKFSLTSNYLGTNTVVKRVDCIYFQSTRSKANVKVKYFGTFSNLFPLVIHV